MWLHAAPVMLRGVERGTARRPTGTRRSAEVGLEGRVAAGVCRWKRCCQGKKKERQCTWPLAQRRHGKRQTKLAPAWKGTGPGWGLGGECVGPHRCKGCRPRARGPGGSSSCWPGTEARRTHRWDPCSIAPLAPTGSQTSLSPAQHPRLLDCARAQPLGAQALPTCHALTGADACARAQRDVLSSKLIHDCRYWIRSNIANRAPL